VITNPVNTAVFTNDSTGQNSFPITATVSSTNTISRVDFYDGGTCIGTTYYPDSGNAYTVQWSPIPGIYLLKAAATDAGGLKGESKPVLITVKDPSSSVIATPDTFTLIMNDLPTFLNVLTNDSTTLTPAPSLKVVQAFQVQGSAGSVQVSYDKSGLLYRPSSLLK
jgi:hypothetical protein